MKRKEASEPIYGTRVLFLFGGTERESSDAAVEWMGSQGETIEPDDSEAKGRIFDSGKGHFVIWIKQDGDYSSLTHEITHAGVAAMAYIGHAITRESDEPMAYYNDWLMKEALR